MNDKQPNISIPVDLTNPGQFFACCGRLELADRLWPGAEGWFERRNYCIRTVDETKTLSDLLREVRATIFEVGDEECDWNRASPKTRPKSHSFPLHTWRSGRSE